jgi:hypothetical protein
MTAFVFVGPTLDEKERPRDWDVEYLPPVEQGQVHALIKKSPEAIGIVDGRFHDIPAVWHKEILWALREGVPVYGSASMGALRAAELASFGMQGIGKIYEQYKDGSIEDDDEVAVAHAGQEDGFLQISDAMVNIRANLSNALEQDCIGEVTYEHLLSIAKQTFYAQRNLGLTLSEGRASGLPNQEIDALQMFLKGNLIDQKKNDAISMINAMRKDTHAKKSPIENFTFERNYFFELACRNGFVEDGNGGFIRISHVLNELKFEPHGYISMRRNAIGNVALNRKTPGSDSYQRISASVARFRDENHLAGGIDWNNWLADNAYTEEQFISLVRGEVISRNYTPHGEVLNLPVLRELQSSSAYQRILHRARLKRRFLEEQGFDDPAHSAPSQVSDHDIIRWYFNSDGLPFPASIVRYAKSLDFLGANDFVRSLREEFYFCSGHGVHANDRNDRRSAIGLHGNGLANKISKAVWETEWITEESNLQVRRKA